MGHRFRRRQEEKRWQSRSGSKGSVKSGVRTAGQEALGEASRSDRRIRFYIYYLLLYLYTHSFNISLFNCATFIIIFFLTYILINLLSFLRSVNILYLGVFKHNNIYPCHFINIYTIHHYHQLTILSFYVRND